ncbi:hypothetical protein [Novosphingobium lindaniclasticum]
MVLALLTGAALVAAPVSAQPVPAQPAPSTSAESVPPATATIAVTGGASAQSVPPGTPVRLMVLREISSRTAKAGDRFLLRVDEPVYIDGRPVIPVGTKAWGEIVSLEGNGAVGKGGRLAARFVELELADGMKLPLRGDMNERGAGNGAGVVLAVVGFGLLGLLTAGDSARFKGGQTITAYVDRIAEPVQTSLPATSPVGPGTEASPQTLSEPPEPGA